MFAYYLHSLDPIIFRIYDNVGPRWYGLAYVLAFVSSYFLLLWLSKRGYADLQPQSVGDFITGCALFGVIMAGVSATFSSTSRKCCASRYRSCAFGKAECRVTAGCWAYCCSRFTTRAVTKFRG